MQSTPEEVRAELEQNAVSLVCMAAMETLELPTSSKLKGTPFASATVRILGPLSGAVNLAGERSARKASLTFGPADVSAKALVWVSHRDRTAVLRTYCPSGAGEGAWFPQLFSVRKYASEAAPVWCRVPLLCTRRTWSRPG